VTDEPIVIPLTITCSQCGQQLVRNGKVFEPQLHDVVRCPAHGDICRLEEAGKQFVGRVREELEEIFKETGFTFTKRLINFAIGSSRFIDNAMRSYYERS
jgi:hypothetical protein